MPSPVGHALAGYAVGTLIAGSAARPVLFAAAGCLPDIDFLFGTHSTYTHSIGAVAAVAGVSGALLRWGGGQPRLALAVACAYASHLLLDWLGNDASPPIGIMALWPFSRSHFQSPVPLLMPVTRQYWLPTFWMHNLRVLASEIAMFGALALGTYVYHRRRLTRGDSMNRTA